MLLAVIRNMGRDVCAPGGGSGSALGAIVGLCVVEEEGARRDKLLHNGRRQAPSRQQAASIHFQFHL
jgi:hypothetical protein